MEPLKPRPPVELPVDIDWDALVLRALADIDLHAPDIKTRGQDLLADVARVAKRGVGEVLRDVVSGERLDTAVRNVAIRTLTKLIRSL